MLPPEVAHGTRPSVAPLHAGQCKHNSLSAQRSFIVNRNRAMFLKLMKCIGIFLILDTCFVF